MTEYLLPARAGREPTGPGAPMRCARGLDFTTGADAHTLTEIFSSLGVTT